MDPSLPSIQIPIACTPRMESPPCHSTAVDKLPAFCILRPDPADPSGPAGVAAHCGREGCGEAQHAGPTVAALARSRRDPSRIREDARRSERIREGDSQPCTRIGALRGIDPHVGSDAYRMGSNACGMGSDACGMGSDAYGMGSNACGMGSDACGMGSNAYGMGSNAYGMGSDACGMGSDACGMGSDACGMGSAREPRRLGSAHH